eukprot:8823593-Pyramimonas_sp.AAC.1
MSFEDQTFDVDVMSTMRASGSSFSNVALLSAASLRSVKVWEKHDETIRCCSNSLDAIPEDSRQFVDSVIDRLVAADA